MTKTLYQKLVDSHKVETIDEENILLYVDLHIMNEYTSPQAFTSLDEKNRNVLRSGKQLATVSHIIPTHDVAVKDRTIPDKTCETLADNLEKNCTKHNILCYGTNDVNQGIEHIIAPEQGLVRPGMVILCGDSHTTTYGALGALGFGIGTSEVGHILATQTLVYRLAKEMRIKINGKLKDGISSKDLIIYIISQIGAQGARGYAVEFSGSAIEDLSIEARMTLCNMAVEAGARAALIAPDQKTLDYVIPKITNLNEKVKKEAVKNWSKLKSDNKAKFDKEYQFDAYNISSFVTWGTSPDQAIALDDNIPDPNNIEDDRERNTAIRALNYMGLKAGEKIKGLKIDRVFIGSCTNSRIEDLRIIANIVKGKKVAKDIRAMIVPGSGAVRNRAEIEGLAKIFLDAGFEWRQPGGSMCLAMNDDILGSGERCASTTNRNFEGRQGRGGRTHLISPAVAACTAIKGFITDQI